MYAAQTTYHRASSVSEAVQLLSGNEGAKVLAGGHSLIPAHETTPRVARRAR